MRCSTLDAMPAPDALIGGSSLAQTTLPGETGWVRALLRAPRLDAVVRRPLEAGFALDHHHRPQGRPDRGWVLGATLCLTSTAPGAIAQRAGHPGRRGWRHGPLDVLSPEADGLVHHVRRHGATGTPGAWEPDSVVAARADAVALAADGDALDALVADAGRVVHLRFAPGAGWVARAEVTTDAAGPPALARAGGALLAAVPGPGGVHGWALTDGSWAALGVLAPVDGQPALAASRRGVVLAVTADDGVRVFEAPGALRGPWRAAGAFAAVPVAGVALAASALGDGLDLSLAGLGEVNAGGLAALRGAPAGWVQALAQEGRTVHQWHHQRADARWARAGCVRFVDPGPDTIDGSSSVKVAQLSGERDTQPWPDGARDTLSRSESTSGVRGTDLGVRVEHDGRAYLLCGDTHWQRRRWATRDSLAAIEGGPTPRVTFHGAPLRFSGGVSMTEYDVPLDAFSLGGDWFVLASSNHFARHQVMGRSVLARAVDDPRSISARSRRPFRLRTLATVSDWRFINLSCQWIARPPGLAGSPEVLALWGSGSYRADDLRLAILDPHALAGPLRGHRRLSTADLGLRYFAGPDAAGAPTWSDAEADAAPLVAGAFGEVSVRWVPELDAFAFLAMTGPDDPAGGAVALRTSPTPWGPWTPRLLLLDWIRDGLSFGDATRRWIRANVADDPVGDTIFRAQAGGGGGGYAPYLFDSRADGDDVVLRYTLSTWNPYQIVLLEHRLVGAAVRPSPA